jgi:iron complex transport system substrate-binding protein
VAGLPRRRVLTLEWLDPVFVGGHWVPEMVSMAGGLDVLGQAGRPSREVPWNAVVEADPDCVVAMPCGFDLDRTLEELRATSFPPEWERLRAVRSGDVYAVDGSAYFSRPGPRLIDGVEILASILHPEAFQTEAAGLFVRCPVSSPRS